MQCSNHWSMLMNPSWIHCSRRTHVLISHCICSRSLHGQRTCRARDTLAHAHSRTHTHTHTRARVYAHACCCRYLEKRNAIEIEMHRKLSQLSRATSGANDSLEFCSIWTPMLEEHCRWSQWCVLRYHPRLISIPSVDATHVISHACAMPLVLLLQRTSAFVTMTATTVKATGLPGLIRSLIELLTLPLSYVHVHRTLCSRHHAHAHVPNIHNPLDARSRCAQHS